MMLNLSESNTFISNEFYTHLKESYLPSLKTNEEIDYKLSTKCEDGVILHAWNWYLNDIKDNMKEIAECGYSSIQISPIQPTKCECFTSTYDWWQLYQPIDFSIGNCLGSADDFKSLCDEASIYGIKIIVDVVTNHLANNNGNGNHCKWDRCDKIPDYLRTNDNYWYDEKYGAFNNNDKDRTSMTHGAIGMPGLNTGNKKLQKIIVDFLNKLQDLGASGFKIGRAHV